MKRVLVVVVVVAVLLAAALFFLMPRGASEGAQLVPAGSVLYLTLPDVQRSINRWPKTAIAQIGAEPAVAEFLSKPAGQLATGGGIEALDLLLRVKPGRLFFAVTEVRQSGANILLGFQFFGGRKDVDDAMARLYDEIGKKVPGSSKSTSYYKGDTVTSLSSPAAPVLFSAAHGSWGFLSNSEAVLQQALDRAAGRPSTPSLVSEADFKTVAGHLSKDPDFLWYGKLQSVYDYLIQVGNQQKAAVNPKQLEQLQKIKALGGTLAFEGENQKEMAFVLYPDAPKLEPIDHAPMALTTPETSIYLVSSMDWKTVASDDYLQSLPPGAQAFLANARIDLKQMPAIMGSDLGFSLSWPAGAMIPTALLAMEIKDKPRVLSLVESAVAVLGVPIDHADSNGASIFAFPPMGIQLIDPQLAISDKFLMVSLSSTEMKRALSLQPGSPTLEGAPAFKPALASYKAPAQAFGYVDSKALFERAYNMLRPIALFAGAMSPSVSQFVDIQKMPDTEIISRHLSPILYTSVQTADGISIESSGPITLSQAAILVGGGAMASYISQFSHLMGH